MDKICSQAMGIILDHIYGLKVSEDLHAGSLHCVWDVCKVSLTWKIRGLFRACKDVAMPCLAEMVTEELREVVRYLEVIPSRRISTKQTQF